MFRTTKSLHSFQFLITNLRRCVLLYILLKLFVLHLKIHNLATQCTHIELTEHSSQRTNSDEMSHQV